MGHTERMCHSKSVREVTETVAQTPYFLGAVTNSQINDEQWTVQISIGITPVKLKIYTGADANIRCEEIFSMLNPRRMLELSNVHNTFGEHGTLKTEPIKI